jgi:hypothetical protein
MSSVNRWALAVLAIGILAAGGVAGCYKPPDFDELYEKAAAGMTKEEVIEALGQPTSIQGNNMFYIYDDPATPVRFRLVLDDKGIVVEKYFESKTSLARKAEEARKASPPIQTLPGEEPRAYPGGPLPRFGGGGGQ